MKPLSPPAPTKPEERIVPLTSSARWGPSLREQARWLDNNHDLVIGIFDKLEERVVGKSGIIVEPHPKLKNGKIAKSWRRISGRNGEWSIRPEVTHQFTRPMLERLMLRSWLRDGEVLHRSSAAQAMA
ncbi:phage portal protein [Klebsiella pneumoniae]|uniref:phage portal protein n=1 Tax=Klebsiella pneumoniae TaxID=573 RepID=UPI003F8D0F29